MEHQEQILRTPLKNKGTGFTQDERDQLDLNGLLPYKVSSVKNQIDRNYRNFRKKETPLARYECLISLLNRNELLFYQLADLHVTEVMQYIYTPTVGEAALQYSMIYQQRRGLYLSYPLKDKMEEMIANIPNQELDVVVVTDGERILGLGDQGIGGMAIPVGKLALYTLFGGIHPSRTLPITLDVGTNNQELLNSELYLGYQHERIRGKEYDDFIDSFVKALKKRFPNVLLQWEDFGKSNARPLLERYQKEILSFNDDIQGTAAVTLSAILAAVKKTKVDLKDQKVVIYGAGSAGVGIANSIVQAMVKDGLSETDARDKIYILNSKGLVHSESQINDASLEQYRRSKKEIEIWEKSTELKYNLYDTVKGAKATILIGVSTHAGSFDENIALEMLKHAKYPIILPLSNPTSKTEAVPDDLIKWTKGRAQIATGSPFAPVEYGGKSYFISQCNNVFIFPAIGLASIASRAKYITDGMFLEAAEALADFSPSLKDSDGAILPSLHGLRDISKLIAIRVAKRAIKDGVSDMDPSEVEKAVAKDFWSPSYDN